MPLSNDELARKSPNELLLLAIEEAAETLHEVSKAMRFGIENRHPVDGPRNIDKIAGEAEQLGATVRVLAAKFGIDYAETIDKRHRDAARQRAVSADGLLEEVETFLARTGMPATQFGANALNDPNLVRHLRGGRELRSRTRARLRAYIARATTTKDTAHG